MSQTPPIHSSPLATAEEIALAAQAIGRGELVAFPTETVYGLGADAFQATAVAKIFAAKGRPRFNPLIVHLDAVEKLSEVASKISSDSQKLISHFWPGPLTIVFPKTKAVPDIVSAGLETVGVRVPKHPIAQALLKAANTAIAAPSANRFMEVSPTTAQHVRDSLGNAVEWILEGGPSEVGLESTIVDCTTDETRVLRVGGTPLDAIAQVLGYSPKRLSASDPRVLAPGMLARHYSPRTKLVHTSPSPLPLRCGQLCFSKADMKTAFSHTEILSVSGDFTEAAANFYSALRRLDAKQLDLIVAPLMPEIGLGVAINDRLRRAAASIEAIQTPI